MNFSEKFFHTIAHPNLVYILLALGVIGLAAEMRTPGIGFPGITGAICLILALIGLQVMPVNWGGVALIGIAGALFVAEAFTPTFGVLTAGGVTAFVIGSLILFNPDGYGYTYQVSRQLIGGMVLAVALVMGLSLWMVLKHGKLRKRNGPESMIGIAGTVRDVLNPEGMVYVDGAYWKAVADRGVSMAPGTRIKVVSVSGMILTVSILRGNETGPENGHENNGGKT